MPASTPDSRRAENSLGSMLGLLPKPSRISPYPA
jgi:hypothetical protein